jgi:Pectate lyase superfamily protein
MTHPSAPAFPTRKSNRLMVLILTLIFCAAGPWAASARAQGSHQSDIALNTRGQPLAGAQIRVCTSSATTTSPCTPLANIYSDIALTQALANPISADGMGNYNFYAAPGRYVLEISGPGIITYQERDVILPTDPSQPLNLSGGISTSGAITSTAAISTTGNLSAFTLNLTGNLTVAGSTAVTGTFTVGGNPVPTVAQANTWTAVQTFKGPSPWRDVTAFGATGNGTTDDGPAFNAAIAASEADAASEVYVPYSASGYLINTCLAFAATHTHSLKIVFAGGPGLTFGSGCPTQNIHTTGVQFEGVGGGNVAAFARGPAKATWTSANAATLVDVVGESITFSNLSIVCTSTSNTHPCGNWDNNCPASSAWSSGATYSQGNCVTYSGNSYVSLVNSNLNNAPCLSGSCPAPNSPDWMMAGSSVYLDSFETDWYSSGSGPGLQLTGFINAGGFGARILGGTITCGAGNTVGICSTTAALNILNWGMVTVDGTTLANSGINYAYLGGSSPVQTFNVNHVLYENATNSLLTLSAGSGSGAGITQVKLENSTLADAVGGYTSSLVATNGSNLITDVTIDNSNGGTPTLSQSANPIIGLYLDNYFDYIANPFETDIWPTGSTGHFFAENQNYFWSTSAGWPALVTLRGGLILNQGGTLIGNDAALHAIDGTNGGNGIPYGNLPGSPVIGRFDSANSAASVSFESPNNGTFSQMFCIPSTGTPTCAGQFYYNHQHDAFAIVAGSQNEMYIGDSLGGVSILRGFQFYGGGANPITFSNGCSGTCNQSFPNGSGTFAFTSQLPFSATSSSIGGSALAPGACTDGSVSVSGATTSMAVSASPASDPGQGFTWNAFVSAVGTVDVRVCNVSGASATPTAVGYNVRVLQ